MFATRRVLHQPLIKFLGKRSWPSSPVAAKGHPAAPPEFQKGFSATSKANTSSPHKTGGAFSDFWEAPDRFWRPRNRELEEAEIEAILSGGASLH